MIRFVFYVVILCLIGTGASGVFQNGHADNDSVKRFIYKIRASECEQGGERVLTGFFVPEEGGLVTALHGVVGCDNIRALNFENLKEDKDVFRNLSVGKADFELDVALLVSDEIDDFLRSNPGFGFKTSGGKTSRIRVIGFPLDLGGHTETVNKRIEGVKPLVSLIPPSELEDFALCQSPSLGRNVYRLEGTIRPGESGAPILNDRNEVIAIGMGGVGSRTGGNCVGQPLAGCEVGR